MNNTHTSKEAVTAIFRATLTEMVEYMWSDGSLLIDDRFVEPKERAVIRSGGDGILDTLARLMAQLHFDILEGTK